MRVIVASRIYWPEPAAAAFRLKALVAELAARGASVRVLTTRPAPGSSPTTSAGEEGGTSGGPGTVRVARWPVLRDRSGYVRGYVQYMSFDLPLILRLSFASRPDVVVAEPPPTTGLMVRIVCSLRRIPYVYYAADVWSDAAAATGAPTVVSRALRRVESWAIRGAERVIAINEGVEERVRSLGAHRVEVVRNGVDTDAFHPDGALAETAPSGPYAIYAGTVSEWQGADVFVRALSQVLERVPDAKLVFLGQGSSWAELRQLATGLPDGGTAVHFVSSVPQADAARWVRGASVALASLSPDAGYDFAFPTKILAGVASGVPVLFAGVGPAAETIAEERLGEAVPHDVEAVADALTRLLTVPASSSERERLARWAVDNASVRATGGRAAAVVHAAALGSSSE
ncbi:glycosyltransferase family 4 protein [Cellulosimicrobium sp. NPDC057127]|uniref:glycosyltransferase family 4 protein n=1 Tax=Cellulosimicrobium sp. NPDC057127 TaxID=3346026 RepID=UPI00363659C0